ncbi:MAG: OmpA family protein [Syntrophotaleaceae bacterium]
MVLPKRFVGKVLSLIFVFSPLLLFGCAQTMTYPALEEARSDIQSARSNPVVVKNAPLSLQKAEQSLNRAEELVEENADPTLIKHQAYLAQQHAAIAETIGNRKAAEDTIQQASAERNRILLEARGAEAEYARQQAERQKAQIAGLEEELQELRAVESERGSVVTLGDVVFDVGESELKPGGLLVVQRLADFMKRYPGRNVAIEGYTDSTGPAEFNQELSQRRARAVRDALVAQGIDSARIETRGYGENFPVATNETVAGRQLNRRVEVVISNGRDDSIPERTAGSN